jgi:AraC-like DNA-binding protein
LVQCRHVAGLGGSTSKLIVPPPRTRRAVARPFAEADAWRGVGAGWRPLFGNYRELGFSFEWHDFTTATELNWARSFHPGSVELCLNLEGDAVLIAGDETVELASRCFTFYFQGEPALLALRKAGQRHRFVTVEFSPAFLTENLRGQEASLHPLVQAVVRDGRREARVAAVERITAVLLQQVESLRRCPVFQPAQVIWFRAKALELASQLFFAPATDELFCTRTQRLARDRVERAKSILKERLQSPPTLDELGRLVNCSPFYLSRLFTQEAGMTMQQFLRQVRMERAAELLRTGQCNVTEAALEVGYNSLSHFSTTFHETFGCCPGLYPLKTPTQRRDEAELKPVNSAPTSGII